MHPNFAAMYPLSAKLGIEVVDAGPGFDELELENALGEKRFAALAKTVKSVFSCNHAKYPAGHQLAGYEVHCFYAKDVEAFLKAGG